VSGVASEKKGLKIKVSKNGPYLVLGKIPIVDQVIVTDSEGTPVKWETNSAFPEREACALCRCGGSKNKPFCDGTHAKSGFDGTETAGNEVYLDTPEVIDGPALKLNDVKDLCASARFCHRGGGIWNLVPKSDNLKAHKIACEEACDCPSGRLNVHDKTVKRLIEPEFVPSIGLVEDPDMSVSGPLWVKGGIPVESADGKIYRVRNRVTLCRCGKSENKPFCDSSHFPEEDVDVEEQAHSKK
jgi:CDGSH-type Zn-finger protein